MAIEGYRWGHSRRHSEDTREVWRGGWKDMEGDIGGT